MLFQPLISATPPQQSLFKGLVFQAHYTQFSRKLCPSSKTATPLLLIFALSPPLLLENGVTSLRVQLVAHCTYYHTSDVLWKLFTFFPLLLYHWTSLPFPPTTYFSPHPGPGNKDPGSGPWRWTNF